MEAREVRRLLAEIETEKVRVEGQRERDHRAADTGFAALEARYSDQEARLRAELSREAETYRSSVEFDCVRANALGAQVAELQRQCDGAAKDLRAKERDYSQ